MPASQAATCECPSRAQQTVQSLKRRRGHSRATIHHASPLLREVTTSDPYANRGEGRTAPSIPHTFSRTQNLNPTPGVPTIPCGWDNCSIPLDDCSRSGIKRHLEGFHSRDIANTQRSVCKWLEDGKSCQRDFSGMATLSKHIATVHLQSCKLRCPECNMWMSRPDALTRHRQASCQRSLLDEFC